MGKIEIKTERGLFGLGEEKEVIYEDEKKIGEIKQETTWCGEKIKNTYGEDGQKVSETRREEGWWGRSIEVTRDNHGQVIREKTHAPEGIIIRNYDAQKNLETITTHEKRILLDFWNTFGNHRAILLSNYSFWKNSVSGRWVGE